jgi:hypothetical protein
MQVCLCILLSACAELPIIGDTHSSLDASIDAHLEQACPIAQHGTGQNQLELRVIRGEIILAAIAGYASTSISSYSSANDMKADSVLVLERLQIAQTQLAEFGQAVRDNNNLLGFYRADLIIAAGGAADAALRPTLRVIKTTAFSPSFSLDTVKRSKQLLLNILKDELYLGAIESACRGLNTANLAPQWKFATQRYAKRCAPLATAAGEKSDSLCVELPWPLSAKAGSGGNSPPVSAINVSGSSAGVQK